MIICGATFTRQPTNFPKSDADRGQNFTALPYSQNHIDYWAQNRVAAMLHEMHHVLVPGCKSSTFEKNPHRWSEIDAECLVEKLPMWS